MKHHIVVNQAGPSHLLKEVECQDSVYIKHLNSDIVVAAVADGLGSEKHSKIGSEIASKVSVEHIADHYLSSMHADKVKALMNNSFVYAYKAILEKVEQMDENPDEFDTTLCLIIFDKNKLYIGQSGDSGAIALLQDGSYVNCTEKQNDEEGCVYPLCCGPDRWVFSEIDSSVCSVMLMTDGIYDRFVNGLIQYDERVFNGHRIEVNVPFAEKLMRRTETTGDEIKELSNAINVFFDNYPKEKIDDDKSLILIFDPDMNIDKMPDAYYEPLDYEALHNKAVAAYRKSLGYDLDDETDTLNQEHSEQVTGKRETYVDKDDDHSDKQINSSLEKEELEKENASSDSKQNDKKDNTVNNCTAHQKFSPIKSSAITKDRNQRTEKKEKGGEATVSKKKQRTTVNAQNKTKLYDTVVLLSLLLFGIVAFFASDIVKKYSTVSYIGIFLICFFSNSTVLLPAPSSLVVIEYSMILNPVLVALCGGFGAAVGEMTGFLAGYHSKRLINTNGKLRSSRIIKWVEKRFLSHPYLIVFVFSIIPFPVFDIVGIMAGAAKLKPTKFFVTTLIGKTIKMMFYVIVAMNVAPIIKNGML